MRELRCLVFTNTEIADAILERRRRTGQGMPDVLVEKVSFEAGEEVKTVLHLRSRDGTSTRQVCRADEVTAALVRACMDRKIPMPVHAEKFIQVVRGTLTLMITVNFNKAPRCLQQSPASRAP